VPLLTLIERAKMKVWVMKITMKVNAMRLKMCRTARATASLTTLPYPTSMITCLNFKAFLMRRLLYRTPTLPERAQAQTITIGDMAMI
jgi:hypothetical protein